MGGFFGNNFPPLEARHEASGINSSFNGGASTFADYVTQQKVLIRKIRSVAAPPDLDKIINGNAPFELEPTSPYSPGKDKKYRRGVLLTHGLSDSPYFMRNIADVFRENGFRVMAVLLPGHGTQPGDMLNVRWEDWAQTVAYGTDQLEKEADEIFLAGYSAGGTLSLYQSMNDKRVKGLFLFAPALEIDPRAAYAWLHKLVSWCLPRQKWSDIKPDMDLYKYESFTKNAATEMYRLTRALNLREKQKTLSIPIFVVASEDDKTVNTSATLEFISKQSHPCNKFIIYTADDKKISENTPNQTVEWVNSFFPEQKILGSAHTAILIPPEDMHYGVDGNYANCFHYYPDDMDKYDACTRHPKECWLGELTDKNFKAGMLRRLMYNPNYSSMKVALNNFIGCLGKRGGESRPESTTG